MEYHSQSIDTAFNQLGGKATWIAVSVVIILQLLFTYSPGVSDLFQSHPLLPIEWLWVIAAASTVLIIVELEKWLLQKHNRTRQNQSRNSL